MLPAATRLGLMVKADGYGHGMIAAARAAIAGGADRLMVVSIEEALGLREAGIGGPVLVVYPIEAANVERAVANDLELSIGGQDVLERTLAGWAAARERWPDATLGVHIEVDTGMGRGGIRPDALVATVAAIDAAPRTELLGIWTHLSDGMAPGRSREQVARYDGAIAELAATERPLPIRHIAATEGLVCETAPPLDMVRIGLAYYGELGVGVVPTAAMAAGAADLRPALAVKVRPARVEDVPVGTTVGYGSEWTTDRPTRLATLPIGYADGWTRRYWPGGEALVRGRRVPLVGRVSMDTVCADVTDVPGVTVADEVVLLGEQAGERITAGDLAVLRGTVPNEVFCAFGPRLPRVVIGDV
jgi:alanine racemase